MNDENAYKTDRYNMFMLIVLFDVIYCLIVTHKLSQTLPKNKRDNGIDIFVVSKTLEKMESYARS